jgi:hypothetical protein
VQQNGVDVSAAILRADGDTGALTGSYHDDRFVLLSHFDGSRPLLASVTPARDGTLSDLYLPGEQCNNRRSDDSVGIFANHPTGWTG